MRERERESPENERSSTNEFCSSVDFITILAIISENHRAPRFNLTELQWELPKTYAVMIKQCSNLISQNDLMVFRFDDLLVAFFCFLRINLKKFQTEHLCFSAASFWFSPFMCICIFGIFAFYTPTK